MQSFVGDNKFEMCVWIFVIILIGGAGGLAYYLWFHPKDNDKAKNSLTKLDIMSNYFEHPFRDFVPESFIMNSIDEDGTCYNLLYKDVSILNRPFRLISKS